MLTFNPPGTSCLESFAYISGMFSSLSAASCVVSNAQCSKGTGELAFVGEHERRVVFALNHQVQEERIVLQTLSMTSNRGSQSLTFCAIN